MNLEDLNKKEPNEISILIEEGKFNYFDQLEWLDICNLLMRKYEENERYILFRSIQKEALVHTSEIRNDDQNLIPIVGREFDFEEEDLNYFTLRFSNTRNPLLKAKFADIVWQESEEKNPKIASKAAEGYLEMTDFFFEKENYNYLTKILVRSLYLSVISTNQEIIENCVYKLEEMIEKLGDLNKIRYTYDLLKMFIVNYEKIKDLIDKEQLLGAIRKGKEYYENNDYVWKSRFDELERKIRHH